MPKASKKSGSLAQKAKERPLHPYSRKALKLNRQIVHDQKIESSKSTQLMKSELVAEKLRWFQDQLDDRHLYTKDDMMELLMQFRGRFNDELEEINFVSSVGNRQGQSNQHAARESAIKITMEEETNQFESMGIEVPDLINKKHLEEFKKWNGEAKYLQNLKMRKISRNDLKKLEKKSEKHLTETLDSEPS